MLLPGANHADFVVTARNFSNEMRFIVEPSCCIHCIFFFQVGLYIVHSARYVLSNILVCSGSKSCGYIMKPYFKSHQILPTISENALTAFQQISSLSCYS